MNLLIYSHIFLGHLAMASFMRLKIITCAPIIMWCPHFNGMSTFISIGAFGVSLSERADHQGVVFRRNIFIALQFSSLPTDDYILKFSTTPPSLLTSATSSEDLAHEAVSSKNTKFARQLGIKNPTRSCDVLTAQKWPPWQRPSSSIYPHRILILY